MKPNFLEHRESGFSMIELMVALLLSSLIMAGLIGVFIATSQNYRTSNALSEIQDKSRYILKVMRRDISEAGYYNLAAGIGGDPVIMGHNLCGLAGQQNVLKLDSPGLAIEEKCFYIDGGTLERRDTDGGVVETRELIEGVLDMRLQFALDTNGDGSIDTGAGGAVYFSFADVADWDDVRAIKMEMLLRSDTENVTDQAQTLAAPFNAVDYGSGNGVAPDKRLYQIFRAVFAVRNRIN